MRFFVIFTIKRLFYFVENLIRIDKMFLYKNPDCGLNINWREIDHQNGSELTYNKKNFFKNNFSIDIFFLKYWL